MLFKTVVINADEYPAFSTNELNTICCSNPISKNRILDYQQTMQKLAILPKSKQLTQLNLYLNSLLPQYDAVTKHKEDYWATPKEFLTIGYGDCEDYVIIKYYSLLHLGYDKRHLYLTIVKEKFHGGYHMVLSYFKQLGSSPLILDNLSFKILPLKQRSDLQAELFINTAGVYKMERNGSLIKIADKYKEFEDLQKRVLKNL
ncbi:hypothetical protein FM071_06985 [Sulfurimonas paralvinellae]|uniref:Uncharacterized protein n=2 Tax=Sulfurimonas paralvinellae TaxID=317658 RepID=A0A7M1BD53_9BACT|nr:hypothetical protein FM071_06985 [Sulfurimonas paralvinellae]